MRYFSFLFFTFFAPFIFAKTISLDLQNTNTRDAVQVVAKLMNINVVISPSVSGVTSLHLRDVPAEEAFNLLLNSSGLARSKIDQVSFIVPRAELMQVKQDELKLKEIVDDAEPLNTRVWRIRFAKADDIARLLQDNTNSFLSKRGRARVDLRTNTVCVQDTPFRIDEIDRLIRRLDIPVQQVLIEARLASVDSDFERELGVNFSVQRVDNERKKGSFSNEESKIKGYSLVLASLADSSLLDIKLAALENAGHSELISSPKLFTANQQPASIESGEEIPYQEISSSGATGVAFKKAVLSLKVTPQVMPDNRVLLQLKINQDKPSNREVLGVPAINTREINTNILVKNGETIVLGGIYESNKEKAQQGIPFLDKIPLVGELFRQQNVTENKRELLIFVTPKIIS